MSDVIKWYLLADSPFGWFVIEVEFGGDGRVMGSYDNREQAENAAMHFELEMA